MAKIINLKEKAKEELDIDYEALALRLGGHELTPEQEEACRKYDESRVAEKDDVADARRRFADKL